MTLTKQTHEENQERAYIAASRRSDRSIEARVESARRASEIHKRRTGKALKVTEKDVLAEEMYEEEEDELPAQYKNLNAHLHTGSTDFDARLQAYLANAVAFRKALSGVAKNRDKAGNVDFVNTRQLADHEALFPKHSDAWKDIVIPKATETSSSPFLPQGSAPTAVESKRNYSTPYDAKSSGLSSRRLSASQGSMEGMSYMGTLRASDLKPRTTVYRPAARHPSMPQPRPLDRQLTDSPEHDISNAGINYASLDRGSIDSNSSHSMSSPSVDISPFSSRLPANAIDMLLPWNQSQSAMQGYNVETNPFLYDGSLFHPRQQDTINATLLPPSSQKLATTMQSDQLQYMPQTFGMWSAGTPKDSGSRKLVEDNMWGNFIEDTSTLDAWDWNASH